MTLIETIDAARRVLKDKLPSSRTFPDDSSSFFEDSEMIDWYNWTQLEVQNILVQSNENWFVTSTQISISASTDEYDMPCACLKIVRIESVKTANDPKEITPIGLNDKDNFLFRSNNNISSIGTVEYYAIKGNKLIVRPIPNQSDTLKIYYERRCDTINTASASSLIPNEYHELLVWGIVENGLIKKECTAEAMNVVLGRRNRLIQSLMISSEDRQVQRSRQVKIKKKH